MTADKPSANLLWLSNYNRVIIIIIIIIIIITYAAH